MTQRHEIYNLDRRVTLKHNSSVNYSDAYSDDLSYTDATVWASKGYREVESEGFGALAQVSDRITYTIRFASRPANLRVYDALVDSGVAWEIVGIREIGRKRYYELEVIAWDFPARTFNPLT